MHVNNLVGKMKYLIIFFFVSVLSFYNDTPNNNIFMLSIRKLFLDYYDRSFEIGTTAFIYHNPEENLFVDDLIKNIFVNESSFVVLNVNNICTFDSSLQKNKTNYFGHLNFIFIFIEKTVEDLKVTFSCLNKTSLWKPRTRIVVILKNYISNEIIQDIFHYVWKIKIINLVLITVINNKAEILGFNPYYNQYFQNLTNDIVFYNKIVDLNGYVLNILLVRDEDITKLVVRKIGNNTYYGGKDGNMIMNIIQHIKAKHNVINLSTLYGLDNPWRPINRFRDIDYLKYDIIKQYNADFFLDAQELPTQSYTENLYPHARDNTIIIVPKSAIRTQYKQFLKLFNKGFSVIIFFFAFICPIIWHILKLVETKITNVTNKNDLNITMFENFRLVLGTSISIFTQTLIENQFLLFLMFCNLIINNYFQSILSSILTVSSREPEINTINDVIKADLRPFILDATKLEAIEVLEATGQTELIKKFQRTPDSWNNPFMKKMDYRIFPIGISGTWSYDRAEIANLLLPISHIVQEPLIPRYQAFQVIPESPYFDVLNKYILRLMESGLYDMWKRITLHNIVLAVGGPISKEEIEESKQLTMKHLKIPFYLLGYGLVVSAVVFIVEHMYFHLQMRLERRMVFLK